MRVHRRADLASRALSRRVNDPMQPTIFGDEELDAIPARVMESPDIRFFLASLWIPACAELF